MRSKIGKDGRVARWPEYETCPRKRDPKYHRTAKNINLALDEGLRDPSFIRTIERVKETVKRPVGTLYSVQAKHHPFDELADCLLDYEQKFGKLPIAIGVRADESDDFTEIEWETKDGKTQDIPVWSMELSKGYGYLYLITQMD
jgi:hypothetical protein